MKSMKIFLKKSSQDIWKTVSRKAMLLIPLFVVLNTFLLTAQTLNIVQDSSLPTGTAVYPKGSSATPGDWSLKNLNIVLYITPNVGSRLFAIKCSAAWHPAYFSFVSLERGNITDQAFFFTQQSGSTCTINASTHSDTNYVVKPGDYLAKIVLRVLKPGTNTLNLFSIDVRDSNNNKLTFSTVPTTTTIFLGDVAAYTFPVIDTTRGDGAVNFGDLVGFGSSYFSTNANPLYRMKYDVGPTVDGSIFTSPTLDGAINFPDLVIFSLMYGKTSLPKQTPGGKREPYVVIKKDNSNTVNLGDMNRWRTVHIPLSISGAVSDVRGMEFFIAGNYSRAQSIAMEAQGSLKDYTGQLFVGIKAQENGMLVDIGMMGTSADIQRDIGSLTILTNDVESAPDIKLLHMRDSHNRELTMGENNQSNQPNGLTLYQNFPNPFNPSTTIRYYHNEEENTSIKIFSMLGQELFTHTNQDEFPGIQSFVWDGRDNSGNPVPSGMYLVRVETASSASTIKITLLK